MNKLILGIICEQKTPPDNRTPLTPQQCQYLQQTYPHWQIIVQPSPHRCFTDAEYQQHGIALSQNLNQCHILLGVKEPPISTLLPDKTYLFFSHTIKKQPYNKGLLQTILQKNIQLIDYECLRYTNGKRIIGFGRFAGIVGAHNGLMAYGNRTGLFTLPPAYQCADFEAIKQIYRHLTLPPMRIALTGAGRVAMGAKETLDILHIKQVSPQDYLSQTYHEPVYVHLHNHQLYLHKDRHDYERHDFYQHPNHYYCHFDQYAKRTDLMINGIYWDPRAPLFFTKAEMRNPNFAIKVIADITCDIDGSIPATLRATQIGNPVMGYNPLTEQEDLPYQPHTIDIMSVDNLPNELPRDASDTFGNLLCQHVLPQFLLPQSAIIEHATITQNGSLTPHFQYLHDYVS